MNEKNNITPENVFKILTIFFALIFVVVWILPKIDDWRWERKMTKEYKELFEKGLSPTTRSVHEIDTTKTDSIR